MLLFSYLLYPVSHCLHSLLVSLIAKEDIYETLFWTHELYKTGYQNQLWEFICIVYYDFYAIHYPLFETSILKQYKLWLNHPMPEPIIKIIYNLFLKKPTFEVFALRNFNDTVFKSTSKRGRFPKDITFVKGQTYQNLFRALYDFQEQLTFRNLKNVHILLHHIKEYYQKSRGELYRVFDEYVGYVGQRSARDIVHPVDVGIGSVFDGTEWWEYHSLLYRIMYYTQVPLGGEYGQVSKKHRMIKVKTELNEYYRGLCVDGLVSRMRLAKGRKYALHVWSGIFSERYGAEVVNDGMLEDDADTEEVDMLARGDLNKYVKIAQRWRWKYFAAETPYWRNIFGGYKCHIDGSDRSIKFDSDGDDEEWFYDAHGLEVDEQLPSVTSMSIPRELDHEKYNMKRWLLIHFKWVPKELMLIENCGYDKLFV